MVWRSLCILYRRYKDFPVLSLHGLAQESESEEEDNILTDISELSAQEVKLCLKERLGLGFQIDILLVVWHRLFWEGSALIFRYGVTKFNDVETREQLVAMLEKVDTWFAPKRH